MACSWRRSCAIACNYEHALLYAMLKGSFTQTIKMVAFAGYQLMAIMWKRQNDAGTEYVPFDAADAQFLEQAFQRQEAVVHHSTKHWCFDLKQMTQTNTNSNSRRGIRREAVCAAATRIEAAGNPGIHKAAENGDIELVKDYATVKTSSMMPFPSK